MTDDETPPTQAQRRHLSRSITSLYVALDELHADMTSEGAVRPETRQQLQQDLATVIVHLRKFRDRDAIDWEEATVWDSPSDYLEQVLEGDQEYRAPPGKRDAAAEPVPAPAEVPVNDLYQSALDVIDLATNLGLTEPTDQSTETVYPDPV